MATGLPAQLRSRNLIYRQLVLTNLRRKSNVIRLADLGLPVIVENARGIPLWAVLLHEDQQPDRELVRPGWDGSLRCHMICG